MPLNRQRKGILRLLPLPIGLVCCASRAPDLGILLNCSDHRAERFPHIGRSPGEINGVNGVNP